ncbi:MAG TPA: D-alanyl-D-alanine carboxypeptidase family protein, partial [Woeseiaceae bacterium]|nr:D-alanyl-D-alanine carboxypeptidase family protein [Woeseiaceae bacterium]
MQLKPATVFNVSILLLAVLCSGAFAQEMPVPSPPVLGAKSYLVIDGNSGYEIASLSPDESLAPASLTKLMSAYAIFKALDEEQISIDDPVTVSEKAWRTPGSRMFIEVGTRVTIRDLLMGMIVQSGNDASVALAEHVAGSESVFADVMNRYASALGMNSSNFVNATGLPGESHYSTARDMATLAQAIINEFPDYYEWYSVKEFTYNEITQ